MQTLLCFYGDWGGTEWVEQNFVLSFSAAHKAAVLRFADEQMHITSALIWGWQDKFYQIIKAFPGKLKP